MQNHLFWPSVGGRAQRRVLGLLGAAALLTFATSCEDNAIAEQCGLTCPVDGVLEGNASISGLSNVDAFFGAVVSVNQASIELENSVVAELRGIAGLLGLEGTAELPTAELAAAVKAGLDAKFAANVEGNLNVRFQPPRCQADLEVTATAAAQCDASVTPGSVRATCSGSCEISVEAQAECQANGTLECRGQAPNLRCEGTCQGSCQLEAAAACEGVCNGTCNGTCSSENASGQCNGTCNGTCQGTCELSAGGNCSQSCEGECTYTPPSGTCEASAQASCEFNADAEASCSGKCEGEVVPPEVSAECKASVEAKAKAELVCRPPELDIQFQFRVTGDAEADARAHAEFRAFLRGFRGRFAALLAVQARLQALGSASANLGVAAEGAVQQSFNTILRSDANLKATIGVGCALGQLSAVGEATQQAAGRVQTSVAAVATVSSGIVSGS